MSNAVYSAILVSISIVIYFNSLYNGFVYDDLSQVLGNPWITDIRYIPDILLRGAWAFDEEYAGLPQKYYRPVMHLIYMFNYHIFGLKPWGWHLANVLFHSGVTVMVFHVAAGLFKNFQHPTPNTRLLNPAFIAGLLFAVHPLHPSRTGCMGWRHSRSLLQPFLHSYLLFLHSRVEDWIYPFRLIFFPGLAL